MSVKSTLRAKTHIGSVLSSSANTTVPLTIIVEPTSPCFLELVIFTKLFAAVVTMFEGKLLACLASIAGARAPIGLSNAPRNRVA